MRGGHPALANCCHPVGECGGLIVAFKPHGGEVNLGRLVLLHHAVPVAGMVACGGIEQRQGINGVMLRERQQAIAVYLAFAERISVGVHVYAQIPGPHTRRKRQGEGDYSPSPRNYSPEPACCWLHRYSAYPTSAPPIPAALLLFRAKAGTRTRFREHTHGRIAYAPGHLRYGCRAA